MSSESSSSDKQKAKTLFDYGNDAALKGNHDYAIDMYKGGLQTRSGEPGLSASAKGDRTTEVQ